MAHQPGANATGGNFVSTTDGIYVAHGKVCVRLDPATGRKMSEFPFPGGVKDATWDYVNVVDRYLIGGTDPAVDKKSKSFLSIAGDDLSSSRRLVVVDRHSGKLLWSVAARLGFRHNAICLGGGKLFAIDRLSGEQIKKLDKDDKKVQEKPKVSAFDLATGQPVWTSEADVFGTWLSYSEKHDVLVEAGRNARDTLKTC
jgi:outer membrane protein assembly factor BamB